MTVNGLDHLVLMVPDLGTAIRDYTDLGFTVVPGGSHPTGTHNALIAFADGTYIELIAFERSNPDHRWWEPAQRGGGLIDFCMRSDDLLADIARFRSAGVQLEISPGERIRPDGFRLRWTLAQPSLPLILVVPFLIEDITPREERIPRKHQHPNGATGIAGLRIAVREPAKIRELWSAMLAQPIEEAPPPEFGGGNIVFAIGQQQFEFVGPSGASSSLSRWGGSGSARACLLTLRSAEKQGLLDARKARTRVMLVR